MCNEYFTYERRSRDPNRKARDTGSTRTNSLFRRWANGVGRMMGPDGFYRILTGFYFFSPVGVRAVPLKPHDFKGNRPDLTGFNRIPWNLVKSG